VRAVLLAAARAEAAGDAEQPSIGREVSLTARPDAGPDEKTPAERRAQRNALKEAKASRRSTSQIFGDDEEVGTLSVNAPFSPAGSMNPAMMSYLQSMTAMYGAYASNPAGYTTVMLRNIPNRYTREMLVERLNKGYKGQFDFVYLPIDFGSRSSFGYAFINLVDPEVASRFMKYFQGFGDWVAPSDKVTDVNWSGKRQGLQKQIDRYRNSPMMHPEVPDEFKPVLFEQGRRIEFPEPNQKLRAPKQSFGKSG